MKREFKRFISYMLVCIMVWSLVPTLPAKAAEKGANLVPTIEENGQVTFYYQGDGTEQEVYVKGSWDASWGEYFFMKRSENDFWSVTTDSLEVGKSYEYGIVVDGEWLSPQPNAPTSGNPKIIRNPGINADGTVTFFYYPSWGEAASDVKLTYVGSDGQGSSTIDFSADSTYTTLYSATTPVLSGTYTYQFSVSGNDVADYNSSSNTFTVNAAPEADPDKVSPVVEGPTVTFYYYAPTAGEVKLAGSMTNWADNAKAMTYDAATGYWSVTLTDQKNGDYEYKFVVDGGWVKDPLNALDVNGNSGYTVTDGYVPDVQSPVIDGKTVTFSYKDDSATGVKLAGSMTDWQNSAKDMTYDSDLGLWTITLRLDPGDYQYKFIADGNWITDPSNAQTSNGNSSFTVAELPEGYYTYNIYYYDTKHTGLKDAALWIWEDGGSKGNKEYHFISQETLGDYTWLKAEIDLDFETLGVIPKNYSPADVKWTWQDATRNYDFAGQTGERNIYLVFGDATAYTECPDLSEMKTEERYVIVEYTRPNGDYDGWNIYTWNSGYGSEVSVPFEEVNGRWIAKVPVTPSVTELSFCVRCAVDGNEWALKDGGDHSVKIPLEQIVAKAKFVQDQGVTEILPYGIGYEINPAQGTVSFYYRDEAGFLNGTQKELAGKVKVCVDSAEYDMVYDEATERFVYTYNGLLEGSHNYCYLVDGEKKLDRYNDKTDDTGAYSVYEYNNYQAQVQVSLANAFMDYNDNNVLTVTVTDGQGQAVAGLEPTEVTVDLSGVGGGTQKVDTALMAASFGVMQNVAPGTVTLPVTVKDQYGNTYNGSTTVEIAAREKGDDFDWDEAVIYFAVTDRFFDGNADNNDAYGIGDYNIGENGSSSYHGGDFAGLTQKLDYLQELGVNTVWITPIVENYMADGLTTEVDGIKSYGYHGYWASDFEKLNKHLGTEAELQTLIDALHERDMKLMVDVVLNHSGYDTDGKNITDYFNGKLDGKKMLRDSSTTVAGSEVLDSLSGLPDFVTEDADVRNLLIEWQTAWVSKYDIDYFRVDTVKHVEDTTWAAFKNALTVIDPDFKMIGEQAGGGYATNAGKLRTGEMDSLLDFDFNDKAIDFVTGKVSEVEGFLCRRNAGIDNTATMGSFLGSHDEDGLMYKLRTANNLSEEESYSAMKVAAALQITAKGQPVIYYGEEVGQTGANNYPYQTNRYDFDWSMVNSENTMLSHYQRLLGIRQDYSEVFSKGERTSVLVSDEAGYDVFSRSHDGTTLYVALQITDEQQEITIPVGKAGAKVTDLYSGAVYTADADGNVKAAVPAAADGGCAVLNVVSNQQTNPDDSGNTGDSEDTGDSENTGGSEDTGDSEDAEDSENADGSGSREDADDDPRDNSEQDVAVDWNQIEGELNAQAAAIPAGSKSHSVWNTITGSHIQVPAKVLSTLKGKNQTLAMHTNRSLAFSITGTDISRAATLTNLDLTVRQGHAAIPASLLEDRSKGAAASRQISMSNQSSFGFTVNMHLAMGTENAGRYANLYRYDDQKGQLVYVGSFKITDNGQAMFGLYNGGEFLVTVTVSRPIEKAGRDYTIVSGDTMYSIAAKFGVRLSDLIAMNPQIRNSGRIYPGQRIWLP